MPDSAAPEDHAAALAAVRAEIDRIDDALHDALMARAALVAHIARAAGKGSTALRPGREAMVLRRLVARHEGGLPPAAIARIWREVFAAATAIQSSQPVAVCDTDVAAGFTQCTREHFGALTPLRIHRSPAQAMADVTGGAAAVAVLPLPAEDDTIRGAWWTALLQRDAPRVHVVARLPFWSLRPESAPQVQALVISPVPPDPSGHDRSLLGGELDLGVSRARLAAGLAATGLQPGAVMLRRDPGAPVAHALIEVAGMLSDLDPRLAGLAAILQRPVVLGAYAVPEGALR